ncbi:MAG: putative bifunctional diguanylate cyclase/phosphodiesterase [Hyphomonas sp.]
MTFDVMMFAMIGSLLCAAFFGALARLYWWRLRDVQRIAESDPLTGLCNRSKLHDAVKNALSDNVSLSLVYIDLENFKEVNDRFGHRAGDDVLKNVAERLRRLAPKGGLVARLGGDEFCVSCVNVDRATLDRFLHALDKPLKINFDGNLVHTDLTIGVATKSDAITSHDELMRCADRAMYAAKAEKAGPVFYSPELDYEMKVEREVREELSVALENGDLELHYQPIIDARTGELIGAEALTRWPNKIGPAGSPGRFIPIAEETGLIIELGDWALVEVLKQIKLQKDLPISLNVSPRQFLNPRYAQYVSDQILKYGIPPHLLKIEITEGVLIDHADSAQRMLRQLQELGVQVMLDDFGTGYSSLSYLQKLKFDALKIDRSFVRVINKDGSGSDMLKSIINLGHSLGMRVVAEGVETPQQAATLQLLGCDLLQGYLIGVPASAEKLTALRKMHAQSEPIYKVSEGDLIAKRG